jgi:hypothetical protein
MQAVRREAAAMDEIQAILADPSPSIRRSAMRAVARGGDPMQRQIAINIGLASRDVEVQEMALRLLLTSVTEIVLEIIDENGRPAQSRDGSTQIILGLSRFDLDNGTIVGRTANGYDMQGTTPGLNIIWSAGGGTYSGRMAYSQEVGEFRGTINTSSGNAAGNRLVRWRHK